MERLALALEIIADIAENHKEATETAREDALEIKLMLREVLAMQSNLERDFEAHKRSTREELTHIKKGLLNGSQDLHG